MAAPHAAGGMNLAQAVLSAGAAQPDRVALVVARPSGAERWSHARLQAAVRGIAGGLRALGLGPGARVMLRLPDGPEAPLAFLGAIAAGLVPMPGPAALTAAEATALALRLAPAAVVGGDGAAQPEGAFRRIGLAEVRAMMAGPPGDWHPADPEDPAYVIATSGTSGRPSLVVHAHRSILARRLMRSGWQGLTAADRLMHAGAMGWSYTLGAGLLDPLAAGATAVLPLAGLAQIPLLARRHDVTILAATPGHFRRLLRAGLPPLPRLRHGLSAGEALPADLRRAWHQATGCDLHEALGMSELNTWCSGSPARPAPEGHAGWPQPGRRAAVVGPKGDEMPRGTAGILAVGGEDPGLALGYLDDPAGWQARFRGGWFLTGDCGVIDADGAVRTLGREDDLMNAGGHRVSPVEVEAALLDTPGLDAIAVAEVTVGPGVSVIGALHVGEATQAALAARAEERLARWKRPRLWQAAGALPLTRTGKLDRKAVAARLNEAQPMRPPDSPG